MGRRIQGQRRGRGSPAFRAPSHRYKSDLSHRNVEDSEGQSPSGSRTESGDVYDRSRDDVAVLDVTVAKLCLVAV